MALFFGTSSINVGLSSKPCLIARGYQLKVLDVIRRAHAFHAAQCLTTLGTGVGCNPSNQFTPKWMVLVSVNEHSHEFWMVKPILVMIVNTTRHLGGWPKKNT